MSIIAIGNINGAKRRQGGIPFESDLLLNLSSRSGSTLVDELGDNDATILIAEFLKVNTTASITGDKTRAAEHMLDGNDYTFYFRTKQITSHSSGALIWLNLGSTATVGTQGMYVAFVNARLNVSTRDGAGGHSANIDVLFDIENEIKAYDYVDILLTLDATAKTILCQVFQPNGTQIYQDRTLNISTFTWTNADNTNPYSFTNTKNILTNFKKFSGKKTLTQCRDNTYTTGLQIHLPSILGCNDVSGNGNHFNPVNAEIDDIYYANLNNTWLLDNGAVLWKHPDAGKNDAYEDIYTPNLAGGTFINRAGDTSAWSSYTPYEFYIGSLTKHLFINSKIRFTHAFFDRSNTTIWKDVARLGYYDSNNVKDFHISEINQRTFYEWLNDGYRGRLYVKSSDNSVEFDGRKTIDNIYLYTTDHKGSVNYAILKYTGDNIAVVFDGSSVDYDSDNYAKIGYFKSTKPMITFRIDDGYQNAYDNWYPLATSLGIKGVLDIHPGLVGQTVETLVFMGWADLETMNNDGWEIVLSNLLDNDYFSDGLSLDEIEDEIDTGHALLVAHGMPDKNMIPNKYSQNSYWVRYLAKQKGYTSCHAGYTVALTHTANPQALDKWNLCAMACDLGAAGVYYNIDDGTTEEKDTCLQNIKDQIDLCVSQNRWAIIYVHSYNAGKASYIQQVLEYAIANNVDPVTMAEGLENCKYL